MKILLNFFPVQSGGGQQVASNFLKTISENDYGHTWFVFVGEDSELHLLSKKLFPSNNILSEKYSYAARLNNKKVRDFVKKNEMNLIYNYAPVLSIFDVPQVVRTVYSNLYFPEIPFWNSYSRLTRIKKGIIDFFRLRGTLKANGLIFENESMLDRAISLFKYPSTQVKYIEPSVSFFDENNINPHFNFLQNIKEFKILYLSSWHLNKNITILPSVALLLKQLKYKVRFILSLDAANVDVQRYLLGTIEKLGVSEYFELIGNVQAIHVHQVVKSCDAMILLSKLECFSSNVVESMYFSKPIIIADEPWARAACKDAGLFVARDDQDDIKSKIIHLMDGKDIYDDLIRKGRERLKDFNTPEEKVQKQVEFLEYIQKKYEKRD